MKDIDDRATMELPIGEFGAPSNDIDVLALEVFEWAETTFPNRTDSSLFLKAYEEMAELIRSDGSPLELADVFILFLDYAVRKDIRLSVAIRAKLEINYHRRWTINPSGTMSHIKGKNDE